MKKFLIILILILVNSTAFGADSNEDIVVRAFKNQPWKLGVEQLSRCRYQNTLIGGRGDIKSVTVINYHFRNLETVNVVSTKSLQTVKYVIDSHPYAVRMTGRNLAENESRFEPNPYNVSPKLVLQDVKDLVFETEGEAKEVAQALSIISKSCN